MKRYENAEAGRVSGIGFAVEAPEQDVGVFHITGGFGVEGQNAGQIGAPNAGDTLEALGYDTETLESLGLYSSEPCTDRLKHKTGQCVESAALCRTLASERAGYFSERAT